MSKRQKKVDICRVCGGMMDMQHYVEDYAESWSKEGQHVARNQYECEDCDNDSYETILISEVSAYREGLKEDE